MVLGGPVLFLFPCHLRPLSHWQSLLSKETVTALWHTKPTLGGFNKEPSVAPALLANFKCTCMHVLPCFSSSPFVSLIVSIAGKTILLQPAWPHLFHLKGFGRKETKRHWKKKKTMCLYVVNEGCKWKKERKPDF